MLVWLLAKLHFQAPSLLLTLCTLFKAGSEPGNEATKARLPFVKHARRPLASYPLPLNTACLKDDNK